ncbi:MAG: hypothetical protein ABIR29_11325, partial [Chthoniobacterales bacterium]
TSLYFRFWDFLSVRGAMIVWFVLVAAVFLLSRRLGFPRWKVLPYATVLVGLGLLMTLLNSFLAQLQPRFALPLVILLIISQLILLGSLLADAVALRRLAM